MCISPNPESFALAKTKCMKTTRILPFLLFALFIFSTASAQVWSWSKKLPGPDNGGLHGIASAVDVQGNHVVLTGSDTLWEIDGTYSLNNQFFVSKYDNQGILLWSKNFTAPGRTWAMDMTTDSAGNIYILSEKFTQIDGTAYSGPNAPNYFTRLTATGDLRWVKPVGEIAFYNKRVIKSDGKNVYLYGAAFNSNSFQFLDTTFTAPSPPGGGFPQFNFLAKVDTAGVRQWQKLFIDTTGYNWPLAMDINNKKEIVFSGYFRKKIWINNQSLTNGSTSSDYQYYAVLNTDNGQNIFVYQVGLAVSGQIVHPAISINDSSVVIYPQSVNSLTWTVGSLTLTYPQGSYLIARSNGGPIKTIKQVSNFRMNTIYDLESDNTGNLYAALKLYFNTGANNDSSFLALAKYKIDSDTGRLGLWQANVGGTYYAGGSTNSRFALAPSVDVRNNDISFTGGFRGTGDFGPHQVAGNNFRKGFIAALKDGACTISGKIFIDANNNGAYDAGEIPVPNRIVTTQNNYFDFTDINGDYRIFTDTGSYTVQMQSPLPYYNSVPSSHPISFSSYGQTAPNKNFAMQSAGNVTELEVDVTPMGPARPGRPLVYLVTLKNKGTTTLSNNYSLKLGNLLTYGSSDSSATVTADSVVWSYNNFRPYDTRTNHVTCNISTAAVAGNIIKSTGYVFPVAGDIVPANNVDTAYSIVTNSYDPNDKLVFPGNQVHIDSVQQGRQFFEYIIRFQNTGNDTAFQVRITDSLTTKVDVQTFELISSSHKMEMNRLGQRTFEFNFPNILLPDSTHSEPNSHGFVKFRVKPVSTLVLTDSVYNFADIYFDYNAPVRTNTIATGFRNTVVTGINDPVVNSTDLKVFPNPATVYFGYRLEKSPRENMSARIYDVAGRVILSREIRGNGNTITGEISVNGLAPGIYFLEVNSSKIRYVREFVVNYK